MTPQKNKGRIVSIDAIKACAVLFVFALHFFLNSKYYSLPIGGISMILQTFMRTIFFVCVPLFILTTGYLGHKNKPNLKHFSKAIKVIGIYAFYVAIYQILYYITKPSDFNLISSLISFFNLDLYWYINMYIGLFLISPYLNIIFKSLRDGKERKWFILGIFIFTIMPATLAQTPLSGPNYWMGFWPLVYYFIGLYIRNERIRIKRTLLLIFIFLSASLSTLIISLTSVKSWSGYLDSYASLPTVIIAICIFLAVLNIEKFNPITGKVVKIISNHSLDMYLGSLFTDRLVYHYFASKYLPNDQLTYLKYSIILVASSFSLALLIGVTRKLIFTSLKSVATHLSNANDRKIIKATTD